MSEDQLDQHGYPAHPAILAPDVAPPAVPRARRRKIAALTCGLALGLTIAVLLAWHNRRPETHFPHAGQDDFANLPVEPAALTEAYGDITRGQAVCPARDVIERDAERQEASSNTVSPVGTLPVEGTAGLVSYQMRELTAISGTSDPFATTFLLLTNGTYQTLRVERLDAKGDVIASLPVLPSTGQGIIWLGEVDPQDGHALRITAVDPTSAALPQPLPTEIIDRCANLVLGRNEAGDVCISYDESDFAGDFTLVTDDHLIDLSGGSASTALDEEWGSTRATVTYPLADQDLLPQDPYELGAEVGIYVSGTFIPQGGVLQ